MPLYGVGERPANDFEATAVEYSCEAITRIDINLERQDRDLSVTSPWLTQAEYDVSPQVMNIVASCAGLTDTSRV